MSIMKAKRNNTFYSICRLPRVKVRRIRHPLHQHLLFSCCFVLTTTKNSVNTIQINEMRRRSFGAHEK